MKLKTLLIAFLALTSALNFSCSSNKSDDPKPNNPFLGTWELFETKLTGTKTTTTGSNTTTENIESVIKPYQDDYQKITFNADNTYKYVGQANKVKDEFTGKYTFTTNKVTIILSDNEETSFTLSNNNTELLADVFVVNKTNTTQTPQGPVTVTTITNEIDLYKKK